jgi:hypothetical protein
MILPVSLRQVLVKKSKREKKNVYMSMGKQRRGGRRTKKTAAIQNRRKTGPAPPLELGDGDLSAYSVAAERGFL